MKINYNKLQQAIGGFVCAGFAIYVSLLFVSRFLSLPMAQRMNVFPDDSFYYMVPALNIAKGLGPTADGITLTSGYHPLWMGVLVILSQLSGLDKNLFFQNVVIVGSLLHAISAMMIYIAAVRLIPIIPAIGVSLMYATLGRGLLDAIGGTEAALLALLLSVFLCLEAYPNQRYQAIMRGILLGLVFLARTDGIFFAIGWLGCQVLYHYLSEQNVSRSVIKSLVLTVISAMVVVLPWIIFSLLTYGTIFQHSLLVKQFWRARLLADSPLVEQLRFSASMFFGWIKSCLNLYSFLWLLSLSFLAGVAYTSITSNRRKIAYNEAFYGAGIVVAALLFYVLASGAFYAVRFPFVREWYFSPARVLWPAASILICALVFSHPLSRIGLQLLQVAVVTALIVVVARSTITALNYPFKEYGAKKGASQFVVMAEWIKEHLPKDAVIGAYSSGILSFFSERPVINLDGLANNDILQVAREGMMDRYLEERGVRYLADHESITWPGLVVGLPRDGNPEFLKRLKEIYRVPCDSKYGDIVLWKILPRPRKGD